MEKDFDEGLVYLLSNPSMPNLYKVGLTRVDVESRIKSLRTTSVPLDFVLVAEFRSSYALQLEKFVHRKLKGARVSSGREFFLFHDDSSALEAVSKAVELFVPRKYTEKEVRAIDFARSGTPSQQAKAEGLRSLKTVMEITKQSRQTLRNWSKHKPELFKAVLIGCKVISERSN